MGVTWCQQPPPARRTHRHLPRPTNAARADGRSGECYVRVGTGGAINRSVLPHCYAYGATHSAKNTVQTCGRSGGAGALRCARGLQSELVASVTPLCRAADRGLHSRRRRLFLNLEGLLPKGWKLLAGTAHAAPRAARLGRAREAAARGWAAGAGWEAGLGAGGWLRTYGAGLKCGQCFPHFGLLNKHFRF